MRVTFLSSVTRRLMNDYDRGYQDAVNNIPAQSYGYSYLVGYMHGRKMRKFAEYANDDCC